MTKDAATVLSPDIIRIHERRAFRTWPAETTESAGGWVLRTNGGVTNRANSAFTGDLLAGATLDGQIAAAEAFYRRHARPAAFMISPASLPGGLDAELAARGYGVHEPSLVRIADAAGAMDLRETAADIELADTPNDAWRDVFLSEYADGAAGRIRLGIIDRIDRPSCFVTARAAGGPVAIGMGVADEGWLTVLGMYTLPEHRGNGHGGAVLRALARWASANGAPSLFLQVMEDNAPALRLYDKVGFTPAYTYHYRVAVTNASSCV